ncbi:hypothetical protein GCM10010168_19770 [Actinoplanes ianthinogenes]|uniref:Integral membrane protein n=2 Tax=Actinoplanes ianthinogenes TaxID=122358 RepID=A0ABM7M7I2_9ACTN|nr:hypothetical protein Aiant_82760 [Actinoplanes ianthinogenes]GGR02968.1 hypothetical protein GCM10010168_19770 [Actinoplanes ianthinogenes]
MDSLLIRALVACYPAGWRDRYGEEYAQLLADLRVHRRPALILNSLLGSVRAHGGEASMTKLIWAAGLFTVAGIGFAKLAEDDADAGHGMDILLVTAAAVASTAVLTAVLPDAVALLRARDARARRCAAVPVAGTLFWYALSRLVVAVTDGYPVHSTANLIGFALIAVTGIGVVAATAATASTVLRREPARPATLITAGGMAVATVAALVWGVQERSAWTGDRGILATPFVPSWLLVVLALAAATALASRPLRRQP